VGVLDLKKKGREGKMHKRCASEFGGPSFNELGTLEKELGTDGRDLS